MTAGVLPRVLSRVDLTLFSVCAILTIDTLASAASMGVSWFSWWTLTVLVFFLPYGLVAAELGGAWPQEGGLFVWVREAMGPRWGSLAAWFYWINNAYWVPSVYLVFAGTLHSLALRDHLPPGYQEGPGATLLQTGIAIVVTWATVAVGVVRLEVAKWVPNVGAVVKAAIFAGLGGLGLAGWLRGLPPANSFTWSALAPQWGDSLAFLPVLVYNVLGFELMNGAGDEMKEPQRDVPFVVLASGLVVAVVYLLGAGGILLAVPLRELSLVTGTWDALVVLGRQWGQAGSAIVLVLGIGFLYACVANIVTWSLGANRVAAAAAAEGALPAFLGRLHPRFQTPHAAFVAMGVISTVLLLGNGMLASQADNVFWMTFRLSGLCFLISYLMLFPAFLLLRYRRPETPRPYRMPGGMPVAWAATVVCWLTVALSCVLFFKPAPGAGWRDSILLGVETALTLVVGLVLLPRRTGAEARREGAG